VAGSLSAGSPTRISQPFATSLTCSKHAASRQAATTLVTQRSGRAAQWFIRDNGEQIVTGAAEGERAKAEKALASYIALKHRPDFGTGHPSNVLVSDVLNEYLEKRAPGRKRADLIAIASNRLAEFFEHKHVSAVTRSACNDYVAWRIVQPDPRATINPKPIKPATARRELVVLGAALSWCWKNGQLDRLVPVELPPQAEPRERHLTQAEAVRLLAGALGFYQDDAGKWRRAPAKINRHVARFILIGLFTGTRHDAILRLHWKANSQGGWIDIEAGVLHRRPVGAIETAKRRPPIQVPSRLLSHMPRWRKLTEHGPVEFRGKLLRKERAALRQRESLPALTTA
jgi:hypothetical protein